MGQIGKTLALLGLLGLGAHRVQAQAAAEAGMLNSNSGVAAQSAQSMKLPSITLPSPSKTLPPPATPGSSPHLLARTGPPLAEVNRKDFEANAGENGGRVLLRSVPSGAEIFVNDLLVGRTPLLLVIAPGKYKIEMRGPREEMGLTTIGVLSKETQTVAINLKQRYPTSVSTR